MEPDARTFTREEAEALLPEIDRLLAEAQNLAERLRGTERQAQAEQSRARANGQVRPGAAPAVSDAERRAIGAQLSTLLERIHDMGVVLRDIRAGLIDFPSPREGRIVYLCWRRGEPFEIRWWHEIDAGFAGRRPL
ncbi:MAG: DUF2203 domain-containing protein [Chloroflexi bacterium]|nr:DUF2203 domain-containing protein [Chloroflexota bacterium]